MGRARHAGDKAARCTSHHLGCGPWERHILYARNRLLSGPTTAIRSARWASSKVGGWGGIFFVKRLSFEAVLTASPGHETSSSQPTENPKRKRHCECR